MFSQCFIASLTKGKFLHYSLSAANSKYFEVTTTEVIIFYKGSAEKQRSLGNTGQAWRSLSIDRLIKQFYTVW